MFVLPLFPVAATMSTPCACAYCTACWSGQYKIPVDQPASKFSFERDQLKDAILRALAETDNVRKRADRERALQHDPAFALLFDLIVDTGLRLFEAYRLRVASVVRDYGLHEREQAPSDSRQVHGAL